MLELKRGYERTSFCISAMTVSSSSSRGNLTLFHFAALRRTRRASWWRPFTISQRGDSSINLHSVIRVFKIRYSFFFVFFFIYVLFIFFFVPPLLVYSFFFVSAYLSIHSSIYLFIHYSPYSHIPFFHQSV